LSVWLFLYDLFYRLFRSAGVARHWVGNGMGRGVDGGGQRMCLSGHWEHGLSEYEKGCWLLFCYHGGLMGLACSFLENNDLFET
jgi:hypothetical protein